MPINPGRLRMWFASAAVLLLAVVAGFYLYGRHRFGKTVQHVASKKLGLDIQQSAQGFIVSKSEGGKTLFTVRAANVEQHTNGGRAELRDVNIIIYGREENRFDQIYGEHFEYDPVKKTVTSSGEVHIDLEGNSTGTVSPDQAPPRELKNPIHLRTSGLIFNQDTGIATTDQEIEFRIPQVTGSAQGATYDSRANTLTLHSKIVLDQTGPGPASLRAQRGVINKNPNRVVLDSARIQRQGTQIVADQITTYLRDDNTVDHVTAAGNVKTDTTGITEAHAQAQRVDMYVDRDNHLRTALLSGDVHLNAAGDQPVQGSAGRVLLDFDSDSHLRKAHATENVRLAELPSEKQSQRVELFSDAVNFITNSKNVLDRAETAGAARVEISGSCNPATPTAPVVKPAAAVTAPATPQACDAHTTATAGKFMARFAEDNRLGSVMGSPDAKVVTTSPSQPDKTTTSDRLTVAMNPAGGISGIVQEGNFHYFEAAAQPTSGPRQAWGSKATYDPATELLVLTGSPRIVDSGSTTTAESMRLNRRTGDAWADGNVKTTYSDLKPQPQGALLATADPIHVTAAQMEARRSPTIAHYTGGARLWQGAQIVEAPSIDFNREQRSIAAQSTRGHRVSTVFVQEGQNGKQSPVNVQSSRLVYVDGQRQARFEGGVVLTGSEGTVSADNVDVYLVPRSNAPAAKPQQPATPQPATPQPAASPTSPGNQLDRIVALGHVVIQQPQRRATGEKLVYTEAQQKFVLTGGSPSIFDAEHGKITGVSLTFYTRDDRVLVEGSSSSPSVTKARVSK